MSLSSLEQCLVVRQRVRLLPNRLQEHFTPSTCDWHGLKGRIALLSAKMHYLVVGDKLPQTPVHSLVIAHELVPFRIDFDQEVL